MGTATVQGIQSRGVSVTIKRYVCNDQEHERMNCDSVVSESALREINLMPFQIAQGDAAPWCYMTAYNQVNGLHASEIPKLLQKILREEWGFNGMVMSDWSVVLFSHHVPSCNIFPGSAHTPPQTRLKLALI